MEPMPLRTRRLIAVVSFLLFIVILPIIALYASGYRLSGLSLVSTGGIHISSPISGVVISLNGEELERTGLFSKAFFFDNLDPGAYVVQTAIDGYIPWSKTLIVESQIVTDVAMLAVPQPLKFLEIIPGVATSTETSATSTTRFVRVEDYLEIEQEFIATSTPEEVVATTSESVVDLSVDSQNGIELYIENGDIKVVWGRNSSPPSIFCVRPSFCVGEFYIEKGTDTVTNVEFFKRGALYRTEESGIFFIEVDTRQPNLFVNVYSTPNSEYKIINGDLYIKDDEVLYEVSNF